MTLILIAQRVRALLGRFNRSARSTSYIYSYSYILHVLVSLHPNCAQAQHSAHLTCLRAGNTLERPLLVRVSRLSPLARDSGSLAAPSSLADSLSSRRLDLSSQHSLLACALQPDTSEAASSFWSALANEFFEDDAELQIQATLDEEGVPRPRFFGAHARTRTHDSLLRRICKFRDGLLKHKA